MVENEGILVKESRPVDLSQIAVIDPLPDIPSIDRKRATEMFANLLSRGEAHLENKQFADALDCFDLALCLESKNRQAQLGRNQA